MTEETKMILEAIEELKGDMQGLKGDVQGLKEDVQGLQKDMEEVRRDVKTLKDKQDILDLKLGKLQDNYEKMDADVRCLSGEVARGFYNTKHQIRALNKEMETVVKVLELKEILPLVQKS